MAERNRLQAAMEQAVDALAAIPADFWPGWLGYVLKCLEAKADADEYVAALQAPSRNIAGRLEAGQW
jgi:hypothetical protein